MHRLCIVVPFRNRFEELLAFVPHISTFLRKTGINSFVIIIVNQVDSYRFNRASLVNVGYHECQRQNCDYLCMHDVDLLPLNLKLDYGFPALGPYHIASPEYHPKYHYQKFIGGILLLTMQQYKQVNGMSNRYWGWGLEDDEFYLRLKDAGLSIQRPRNLRTNSTNTFLHIHDRVVRRRDYARYGKQREETRKRDRVTGLQSVQYTLVKRVEMNIEREPFTLLNVKLHCNVSLTPWCSPS
ncbi:unnamed protein product [Soboliphyme baturini]|uniref:Beta-1,4-galactosyltransferase 7 n=1 Tax=Soboliphyme baturini TaxID=241478 RepID=A0A183IDB8_9BILA|nr:unnamed protein product [Soboliphyme baturini]